MGGTREVGGGNGVDGWSLIGGSGWGLWMRWNADSMIKWWFGCYCDCVVSLGLVGWVGGFGIGTLTLPTNGWWWHQVIRSGKAGSRAV